MKEVQIAVHGKIINLFYNKQSSLIICKNQHAADRGSVRKNGCVCVRARRSEHNTNLLVKPEKKWIIGL